MIKQTSALREEKRANSGQEVTKMPNRRKEKHDRFRPTKHTGRSSPLAEDAVEAAGRAAPGPGQTASDVRSELEALMAALREANGHLVAANLRSAGPGGQMKSVVRRGQTAIQAKDDFFSAIHTSGARL